MSSIVLRALIIDAMSELVTDDRANRAKVHRQEDWGRKGILEDADRHDELVVGRAVVSVHRQRPHAPAIPIARLVQLREHSIGQHAVKAHGVFRSARAGYRPSRD